MIKSPFERTVHCQSKALRPASRKRMTYIAAFKCHKGIVMCSDTQDTVADQKQEVEKLYAIEDGSYSLALGGAGVGEVIDAFAQEIMDSASKHKPATISEFKDLTTAALNQIQLNDSQYSTCPDEYKKAEYLVAAKPVNDDFVIFHIRGRRIFRVKKHQIIGNPTAPNKALLKRMYADDLPMQQAVMLSIYLVLQSKTLDTYVGGEPRVALVAGNGSYLENNEYIAGCESRVLEFAKLADKLMLASLDAAVPPSKYPDLLETFKRRFTKLRDEFAEFSSSTDLKQTLTDPSHRGSPYPKVFPGALQTIMGNGQIVLRERTPQEVEADNKMFNALKEAHNQVAARKVAAMFKGRKILYLGEEKIHVRGSAGLVPDSDGS